MEVGRTFAALTIVRAEPCSTLRCRAFAALTVVRSRGELESGARGADVFAGAKGMCLRQGVSLKRGGRRGRTRG